MMNAVLSRVLLAVALGLSASLTPTAQAGFQFVTLDVKDSPNGATATGINNAGQIVGRAFDANGVERAFLYSGGSYTILDPFVGVGGAQGNGINNQGDIALYVYDSDGSRGYIVENGTYIPFLPTGVDWAIPQGINDHGDVVGFASDGMGYLLRGGVYSPISIPGTISPSVLGINNAGDMVGTDGGAGFIFSGGTLTTFAVPGAIVTWASGVNNLGWVVGSYLDSNFDTNTFIYRDGVFTTIALPGLGGIIQGINDHGDIVGVYSDENYVSRAFVGYSVVPEPSSLAMIALGIPATLVFVRRYARGS